MIKPHVSVGIAQVIFYAPALPAAVFVLAKNWTTRPRMAWYPLLTFCLFRLAGGIVSVIRGSNPYNIGLIIADTVLLNVGLVPLLISLLGIIRITLKSSLDENSRARKFLKLVRLIFTMAVILLAVAGGLSSDQATATAARALTEAAYVILAAILALAAGELVYLLSQKHRISPSGYYYIGFALLSVPFIAARTAYGLLYAFTARDLLATWNPVFGSPVAFALMGLLSEYVAFVVFMYLGFHKIRHPVRPPAGGDHEEAHGLETGRHLLRSSHK